MRHQMSTTTVRDEYALNCTCTPTGTLFIGSKEDAARNMVQHQQMVRERATRACPDCGRPQHYTGTEHGWAHDALVDTWHCADPRKAGA